MTVRILASSNFVHTHTHKKLKAWIKIMFLLRISIAPICPILPFCCGGQNILTVSGEKKLANCTLNFFAKLPHLSPHLTDFK